MRYRIRTNRRKNHYKKIYYYQKSTKKITRNISNYSGPSLELWSTDVNRAVPAAAAFVPDADAQSLPEPAPRRIANKLDSNAT